MSFDFSTLITSRTQADVDRAGQLAEKWNAGTISDAEKAEWLAGQRGLYDVSDFDRVSEAVHCLYEQLTSAGYVIDGYQDLRGRWSIGAAFVPSDREAYLRNIRIVREVLALPRGTALTPDVIQTVAQANAIEQILSAAEAAFCTMEEVCPKVGQSLLFAGFAIYPSHKMGAPVEEGLRLYTADGLAVYTADGLAVYLES